MGQFPNRIIYLYPGAAVGVGAGGLVVGAGVVAGAIGGAVVGAGVAVGFGVSAVFVTHPATTIPKTSTKTKILYLTHSPLFLNV